MNSAVLPQQLHANLMIAIDTVDSTALTGIIRALRVIIEARKGELGHRRSTTTGAGGRGEIFARSPSTDRGSGRPLVTARKSAGCGPTSI